jgi:hypothetical protein
MVDINHSAGKRKEEIFIGVIQNELDSNMNL